MTSELDPIRDENIEMLNGVYRGDVTVQEGMAVLMASRARMTENPTPPGEPRPARPGERSMSCDRCKSTGKVTEWLDGTRAKVHCPECGGSGVRSVVEQEKRRMDAYYFSFASTGVDAIDDILSAVACAGKAYHHTGDWSQHQDRASFTCRAHESFADAIQRAADIAAHQLSPHDQAEEAAS